MQGGLSIPISATAGGATGDNGMFGAGGNVFKFAPNKVQSAWPVVVVVGLVILAVLIWLLKS